MATGNFQLKAKVAKKGGISVYGLGQSYPVTLYRDQWEALAEAMPGIIDFAHAKADECDANRETAGNAERGKTDEPGRVAL